MKDLKDYVITIPDFPEEGIMFRDVTGILESAECLKLAIDELEAFNYEEYKANGFKMEHLGDYPLKL